MLFVQDELANILGFVSRFYTTLGVRRVSVDVDALEAALEAMREHLGGQPGGVEGASPFRKAAAFLCHFIEAKPIGTPLPLASTFGAALAERLGVAADPNTVLALRIAMESLHGAILEREDGKTFQLERRLDLSTHSYIDVVDALTDATRDHFKYVAVLLEQLAYKTNPRCQYPTYQVSNYDSPECRLEPILGRDALMDVWAGRARLDVVRDEAVVPTAADVIGGIERSRSTGVLETVRDGPPFHFRQSRDNPELVDRVAIDGTYTTGRILDGVFVEEAASDVS